MGVAVAVMTGMRFTSNDTGTVISGYSMSLVNTVTRLWCVPGPRREASAVTVIVHDPPAGMLPLAGLQVSQSTIGPRPVSTRYAMLSF